MKDLYKVEIERTTYQGRKSIETLELFAESPKEINTYRLGGFQRDSIKILSARKIRARNTIEVYADIERNSLSFCVDVEEHLDSTLNRAEDIENKAAEAEFELEEYLESQGYHELRRDNSYNYSSDFDDDINFRVYSKNKDGDWIYDDVIVVVSVHQGLDVRSGYSAPRAYRGLDHDGLCYFLQMHVGITVETLDGRHVEDFDGDWAAGEMLKEYKLVSVDQKTQEIIVSKDGENFRVRFYHPAEGV
jgi:hypothetical protein